MVDEYYDGRKTSERVQESIEAYKIAQARKAKNGGHHSRMELNELSDYVPNEDGSSKSGRELSELRVKERVADEEWPEREEFKSTNAFGMPKKKSPSQLLKQEWPPRITEERMAAAMADSELYTTNAFGMPMRRSDKTSQAHHREKKKELGAQDENMNAAKPEAVETEASPIVEDQEEMTPEQIAAAQAELERLKGTNAFGMPKDWYEKKELAAKREREMIEAEARAAMPTAEEIQAIKDAAREEGLQMGFSEGKKAGFEKGFAEGKQAGFEEGKNEGLTAGREEAAQEAAPRLEMLDQSLSKLASPAEELDEAVAKQLAELAMRLTRRLVPEAAWRSDRFILDSLIEAVSLLPSAIEGVTVKLSPRDKSIVESLFPAETLENRKWTLVADDSVADCDLCVMTRDSSVSESLSRRLDELITEFIRANLDG